MSKNEVDWQFKEGQTTAAMVGIERYLADAVAAKIKRNILAMDVQEPSGKQMRQALADSVLVQQTFMGGDGEANVFVGEPVARAHYDDPATYAIFIEYGFRISASYRFGKDWVKRKQTQVPARPFVKPAVTEAVQENRSTLKRMLREAVQQ